MKDKYFNYNFPLELLEWYGHGVADTDDGKQRIIDTLMAFDIEVVDIRASVSPTVTLYDIIPLRGTRISKIRNLEDDLAMCLKATGIRIIAPRPGMGTIGIEVPNKSPAIVGLQSVLDTDTFRKSKAALPMALGRSLSNMPYVADLAKMPHLLMAGATGQGKSVGINTILISLLYAKKPEEVKFVLIDPKRVEMPLFWAIEKHYLAKLPDIPSIITEVHDAITALNALVHEMQHRYDLLQKAKARNIGEFVKGGGEMPYIVVCIDEFADLIMEAGKDVERPITRLAQLARAVGIHLIVATQRPSVNIITGLIKANFPARIAYRVVSRMDSRVILDTGGAEQLVGRGDMLVSTGKEMARVQCSFVDTPEIDRIVTHISKQQPSPKEQYTVQSAIRVTKVEEPLYVQGDSVEEVNERIEKEGRIIIKEGYDGGFSQGTDAHYSSDLKGEHLVAVYDHRANYYNIIAFATLKDNRLYEKNLSESERKELHDWGWYQYEFLDRLGRAYMYDNF